LLNELYKIHSFYKFSLDSYVIVVNRAIDLVQEAERKRKLAEKRGGAAEGEEGEEKPPEEQV